MPSGVNQSNTHTQLRDKAEAHLEAGSTPSTSPCFIGVDALLLLQRLSSNPDSAEDALKLLHELQVHQVEIDLQNAEIVANEQALVEGLDHYRGLYDAAPFAYFLVDREGNIAQGNLAAAALFDTCQDNLAGRHIDSCLVPEHRVQLRELLLRVAKSGVSDSCLVMAGGGVDAPRGLLCLASPASKHDHVLLACCDYPDEPGEGWR